MADDTTFLKKLQGEIDELILQLNLGKADAVDYVEKKKESFKSLVDEARERISGNEDGSSSSLKQKLDELKLQLALGRMESRDALEEQRGKIHSAIQDTQTAWEPVEDDLKTQFHDAGESLQTKLDALALDLGIRRIVAEEELKFQKEKVKADLEDLQSKIEPAMEKAGDKFDDLADDAKQAFDKVKHGLRSLFD
ncbi:MAG: hypothetical protein HKN23_19490 [Verrucomicrobiales bacterium]|nr:hypothetical protein [Verrucomicrobiales bacterium]